MHKTTSLRQKIYNIIREDLEVISKDIYFAWAAINKQIVRDARGSTIFTCLSLYLRFFEQFERNNNENCIICVCGGGKGREGRRGGGASI